jgi:signal transduction histidine kinase
MVALLVADNKPEGALALEALWNWQAKKRPFALMCAYPMQQLGDEALTSVLVDVCSEHSTVVPTESYSALDGNDARLRAIAALQQKAASLEKEVAERRRIEEQLQVALAGEQAARAEAEAALRVREEFLSIASHELRTPITVLTAQAQLSLRRLERNGGLDPERVSHALRMMGTQADKLARLVSQLLDVSRLESGKLQLEPHPTNLARVVEQVVAAARSLAEDTHSISLTAPAVVECEVDALRLEQVLTNLIDNAVKYSPPREPVEIVLHGEELTVRDHGPGITAEDLPHIFDRFYRGADARRHPGSGLGLAIVRQVVDQHGGSVTAEPATGGGTLMRLRLAGRTAEGPEPPSRRAAEPAQASPA